MRLRLLALASASLLAQHTHSPGSGRSAAVSLPPIGSYSFPIQTSVPDAQRYFSAGVAMLYSFNHDEAQKLFLRAAELDGKSPMPHWGVALSFGRHINADPEEAREQKAWDAIARAKALSTGAPRYEQRYVDALATRYSSDPKEDRRQLARNYAAAMAALHRDYPDDPDAATLYAESLMNLTPWKYWGTDGEPADGTIEFVSVLEGVLKRWPDHPGANHYYIHAVEASPHPERALAAANRVGTLVPSVGHMVHMPSHIYARLGHWDTAVASNVAAVAADRTYLKGKPAEGLYPMMYYPHNIHFLLYAQAAQGNCAGAVQTGKELVSQVAPGLEAMPMLQGFVAYTYQLAAWCPAVALPAAPATKFALSMVAYQYAHGTREAWRKNAAGARQALAALSEAAGRVAPETIYESIYTAAYLRVAALSLAARIADAEGDLARAESLWRDAVQEQDKLRYDEPPLWYYQVRQSLGAIMLRAGKLDKAEAVLRESLSIQPRDGRTLFLLWKTLAAGGRQREADIVEREFRAAWKGGAYMPRIEEL